MANERRHAFRRHRNGITVKVAPIELLGNHYSYRVLADAALYEEGPISGFQTAKSVADQASLCPQPCDCPSWVDKLHVQ